MSSSVCYFNFSPLIDKRHLICYAVILLWFLILISLFDMAVVTQENLHLKKNEQQQWEYVEWKWKWKLIFNEFVKCTMTNM